MFVQVIQGKVKDAAGLQKQWEKWDQELKPNSVGFLGATSGVTPKGEFISVARFEDEAKAKQNSDSKAQGEWWNETSQYLDDVLFHDCTNVDLMQSGGSDDAGFVQVIQGKVTDIAKAKQLDEDSRDAMSNMRPDVIGGLVAWNENGRFTNVIYFTSEAEARENEKKGNDSPEAKKFMEAWGALQDGEPKFLDLPEPWYSSK